MNGRGRRGGWGAYLELVLVAEDFGTRIPAPFRPRDTSTTGQQRGHAEDVHQRFGHGRPIGVVQQTRLVHDVGPVLELRIGSPQRHGR